MNRHIVRQSQPTIKQFGTVQALALTVTNLDETGNGLIRCGVNKLHSQRAPTTAVVSRMSSGIADETVD